MSNPAYTIKPFPAFRQFVIDGLELASRKHMIHGLMEVDITTPRQLLHEIREQTGESLSFTAYVIYCCAKAVNENKHMHAYRDWRNRLILFEEVDVSVPVEQSAEGRNEVLQAIIRAANRKSIQEIHDEIRQAQSKKLAETPLGRNIRWYVAVPAVLRHFIFRVMHSMPHLVKKYGGTVGVTAVGMFGNGAGWGVPFPGYTLTITVGGIVSRPGGKAMQNREHLCITISFDHDIIDGAPAARFVQRFKELLESGSGLCDEVQEAI